MDNSKQYWRREKGPLKMTVKVPWSWYIPQILKCMVGLHKYWTFTWPSYEKDESGKDVRYFNSGRSCPCCGKDEAIEKIAMTGPIYYSASMVDNVPKEKI